MITNRLLKIARNNQKFLIKFASDVLNFDNEWFLANDLQKNIYIDLIELFITDEK